MEENKNKEIHAFAKKYIPEIKSEKLSSNFTSLVMNKIVAEQQKAVYKSIPLMSKKMALVISSFLFIFFISILFKKNEKSSLIFPDIEFSFLKNIDLIHFYSSLAVSSSVLYSILLFGLMFLIQVIFLKKYFDGRVLH